MPDIICPGCFGDLEGLACLKCHTSYPLVNGIPVLLCDQTARTKLDANEYKTLKSPNPERSYNILKRWQRHIPVAGKLLEIGAGPGTLTYALIDNDYDVTCTDISPEFLSMTRGWMPKEAKYYACDAERLPFKPESFDIIIGNSVLHHLLHYESVLKGCFSIIKRGGVVGFSEPTLEGRSLISYIVSLMEDEEWTDREKRIIDKYINYPAVTVDRMENDRDALKDYEDKHLFGIEKLRKIGREIGYSDVYYENSCAPQNFGKFLFDKVEHDLKMRGVDVSRLDRFYPLFDKLSIYSGTLKETTPFYFGYFIFRKD